MLKNTLKKRRWLELTEYILVAGSVIGTGVAAISQQVLYATTPISLSLVLNVVNRNRAEQRTRQHARSAIAHLDEDKSAIEQQLRELMTRLEARSHPEESEENLPPAKAIERIHQRQNVLDQSMAMMQAQLDSMTKQFKHRPELEQIESLSSVIVDLQQFINQLPQWGHLQQQELNELKQQVERAISELPDRVETAVQQRDRAE